MPNLFQPSYKDGMGMPTTYKVWGIEYFFAGLFALFFAFVALGGWADGAKRYSGLTLWAFLAVILYIVGVFCWKRFMYSKLGPKPFWGIIIGASVLFGWMLINMYVNFK